MVDKDKASKGVTGRADRSKAGKPAKGGKSTAGSTSGSVAGKSLTGKAGVAAKGVADPADRAPAARSDRSLVGEEVTVVTVKDLVDKAVDEKDKIDAIVSPRTDDPTARVVAGARVRNCAQCLADVFVAPSTFAYFKGKLMPPIWCVPCAMLAAETHGKGSRTGRA